MRSLLCLVAGLLGCRPALPAAPVSVPVTHVPTPSGLADDAPLSFVLRPGDLVKVHIDGATSRDHTGLVVDALGLLHVPLLGDVEVGGLGLSEAELRLGEELRRYERFSVVSLVVEDPAGHRASVAGEIEKPGVYAVAPSLHVADLVALAGGLRHSTPTSGALDSATSGDLAAARLVRDGAIVPVAVDRAIMGDPRHNVRVRPGDLLYIPPLQRTYVSVLGEVKDPRVIGFRPGLRASEALAAAGGPLRGAAIHDVRLIRGPLSAPQVYRIDIATLVDGSGHDIELSPGDVLYVARKRLESTLDLLQRVVPALAIVTAAVTLGGL